MGRARQGREAVVAKTSLLLPRFVRCGQDWGMERELKSCRLRKRASARRVQDKTRLSLSIECKFPRYIESSHQGVRSDFLFKWGKGGGGCRAGSRGRDVKLCTPLGPLDLHLREKSADEACCWFPRPRLFSHQPASTSFVPAAILLLLLLLVIFFHARCRSKFLCLCAHQLAVRLTT